MPTYDQTAERPARKTPLTPERRTEQMLRAVERYNAWRDTLNPLRSLTMPTAVSYLEQAQRGAFADIMWLYETGIECTDADLSCIIERTEAALDDTDWQVQQISDETDGFDAALADDQEAFLRELYEGIPNLYEAIRHLAGHRFRGFAHLNPWVSPTDPMMIETLHCIPQWNLARAGYSGEWYWNPEARQVSGDYLPKENRLAPEEIVWLQTRRPVNRIGLVKYVRATTADKDWDAYVEIFGIPGVFIVAPEGADNTQMAEFLELAEAAAQQGSGALPAGSQVVTSAEARNSQPFQARLEWLQKQLVLAGTGGLLTVLAESGSGTLAGSVHEQAFRQIGRALARRISEAFQRQLDKPRLARMFPGKPVLAYFDLKARQEKNTADFVAQVVSLAGQGYKVSPDQVEQETGYEIQYSEPAPPAPAIPGAAFRGRADPATPALDAADAGPLAALQAIFADLQAAAADAAIPDAELERRVRAAAERFPELLPELTAAIARPMALDMAAAAVEGAADGVSPENRQDAQGRAGGCQRRDPRPQARFQEGSAPFQKGFRASCRPGKHPRRDKFPHTGDRP